MISSHTDIGLHNSQYIQRYNSGNFIDKAILLTDSTDKEKDENKYRYTIEGTWVFGNYLHDKGIDKTRKLANDYIKQDRMGVCGEIAGAHIQNYGLEELCRSTYGLKKLRENWGIETAVFSMIDNNGISWSMIGPYAEAGYKNLFFAPNQWNPLPSKIWNQDTGAEAYRWNPQAGGGGARIDIRYDSEHPMVFFWEDSLKKNKILVWCSTQYIAGGGNFGLTPDMNADAMTLIKMENGFSGSLPELEKKYDFDVWLFANYCDDQEPSLGQTKCFAMWNEKYKFPKIRTAGNINIPFDIIRERFSDSIPTVKGDITGGWYQHPLSAAEILSKKHDADRKLPTAEKLSSIASILDSGYKYPAQSFERAWDALLLHDEHSYGTSGYQGRRVYETWMQHKDWVDKVAKTADKNIDSALNCIKKHIYADKPMRVIFNPTMRERIYFDECSGNAVNVPALGYTLVKMGDAADKEKVETAVPPIIENSYYKITFAKNGAMSSIFDKESERELIKKGKLCNSLIYTDDNHESFKVPENACFEVITGKKSITVISHVRENIADAEIVQTVVLNNYEKLIEIDNSILHAKDLINNNRYYRYLYYGFEFDVEGCRRLCNIHGTAAEYGVDVTGHGTDTYMTANEWCAVENGHCGVALFQKDTELVEFGEIHADKTDFGDLKEGSEIYSYAANDWLQMHQIGGNHLNFNFRYAITSYEKDYKTAKIPQKAELYLNPVIETPVGKQNGKLPEAHSFIKADTEARLLTIKLADDKKGFILRFLGNTEDIKIDFMSLTNCRRVAVDETENSSLGIADGFTTYKVGTDKFSVEEYTDKDINYPDYLYSGLITHPIAAPGEKEGMLYILWGENSCGKVEHYDLYRGEFAGFVPDMKSKIAEVRPEEYRCVRYIDENLKSHTEYFYRIKPVFEDGTSGEISEEFAGFTKETAKNVL